MAEISNMDDTIDSREVISKIEELESELQDLKDALDEATQAHLDVDPDNAEVAAAAATKVTDAHDALADWNEEYAEELKALLALQEECDWGDWKYGATLIRESYFEDYCREMVADIGGIPRDMPNYLVIDWEATANNLSQDYTLVDYGGQDYYIRS